MKKFKKKKIRINFLVLPISVLFPFCQKKKLATNKQTNGSLYAAIAKNTAKTNIDKHMVG